MKKINIVIIIDIIAIIMLSLFTISYSFLLDNNVNNKKSIETTTTIKKIKYIEPDKYTNIVINAIGDCTIGYDDNFGYTNSFNDIILY